MENLDESVLMEIPAVFGIHEHVCWRRVFQKHQFTGIKVTTFVGVSNFPNI